MANYVMIAHQVGTTRAKQILSLSLAVVQCTYGQVQGGRTHRQHTCPTAAGGTYVDSAISSQLVDSLNPGQITSSPMVNVRLSEREDDVLRLIAQGYSSKEVASRLDLSIKTIETYKARSMEKLDLKTRVDIIRFASSQGWLE